MNDDLSIKWTLANPLSIQTDDTGNAWNSGAARDIAAMSEDKVLVATDTGSIWMAGRDGSSFPVADDVESPDFWCITAGLYGDDHFYAGGAKLYETNISKTLPLLNWREIPVTWQEAPPHSNPYTVSPSAIYRIAILREDKRMVLATTDGVVWADIPDPPSRPSGCLLCGISKGTPPGTYTWKKAQGLDDVTMGFLGLAVGAAARGEIERSISVASWGYLNGKVLEPMQFYRGVWEGGELVMKKANMNKVEGIDNSLARATTMTSCDAHPERMYAISSDDGVGAPAMFWMSSDDGKNWTPSMPTLNHPKDKTFIEVCGQFGNSQRPCNGIAASRQKQDTVIVVWRKGALLVSEDAGETFRLTDTDESPHIHGDVHAVYFDPTDFAGERVFIAHDGGISMFPELGRDASKVESFYNRQLATLQFQTAPSRMFYGGGGANPVDNGAMIGGLQDSGVVTSSIQPLIEPWRITDGGDGFQTTFLSQGAALWNNNDETHPPGIGIVRHSFWGPTHRLVVPTYIPVWKDDPQMPFPGGLPQFPGETVVFASVHAPGWSNREGENMYAVAAKRSSIYGLFYTEMGTQPRWEFLAHFPLNDNLTEDQIKNKNWEPWAISAVASLDGGTIYVGTNGGRLIVFEQATRLAREITVPLRTNPWGDTNSVVNRIVVANNKLAFATYNIGRSSRPGASYSGVKEGYVLRILPPHAEVLKALPVDGYYGIEVAREPEHVVLYAATDSDVYVSRDDNESLGDSWLRASQGLPKRPHCGDLSYVEQPNGERWLYLSTFGRSFWRAQR